MLGGGGGMAYSQGGWDGVAYFAGGVLGGYMGFKTTPYVRNWAGGYGFRSNNAVISDMAANAKFDEAIEFAHSRYGIPNGKLNLEDQRFWAENPREILASTNIKTGEVEYGILAFREESALQGAGFHEGIHVMQVRSGKVNFDGFSIINRYVLEMDACKQTILNAWRLNLSGNYVNGEIKYYNFNANESGVPAW